MKIGVDAGCLGITDERLKVGVYTVVKNMLIELSKQDKENQYYLYSFHPIEKDLMKKFGNNMHNIIVVPTKGWLRIALPLRLAYDKPSIFIAANQAMPYRLPFSRYKTLGIFYDIAFEKYPELYSYAASVEKHKINSRNLAQQAEKIIAISQSTKKDIEKLYGVKSQKILIAYPGFEALSNSLAYINKNPYFLFVGAFKKSKNIPFLINAFSLFIKKSHSNFNLLLVGGDKWMDPEIKETLNTLSTETEKRIRFLGFVNSKTLESLYKGAYAFVSPSLYEGFGLPFLEAQAAGVPVIGSYSGSLQEVIGSSGLLVNPKNINYLAKAMSDLASNKNLYKKLVAEGRKNTQKYSWKLFAKKIQSAVESIT